MEEINVDYKRQTQKNWAELFTIRISFKIAEG